LTDRGGYGMALLVTAVLLLSAVVNFTWLTPANLPV
jgi:hypothetical protein